MTPEPPEEFLFDHGGKPCPCCGASDWRSGSRLPAWPLLADRDSPRLVECGTCGSAHLPRITVPDYVTIDPATGGGEEVSHQTKAARNIELLQPVLDRHLRAGDRKAFVIGCSTGYEIDALLAAPSNFSEVDGLDANDGAVGLARERFSDNANVHIHQGWVEALRGDYSLLVATMVWEHMPDPYAALAHVASQQSQGGLLAIQVPRYDNRIPRRLRGRLWYYVMDAHLWYFTRRGITSMFERCGYDVIAVLNAPRYATLGFAIDKVIRATLRQLAPYLTRSSDPVARWERIGELTNALERRIDRWSELGSRWGLGITTKVFRFGLLHDAMTVVARKR